MIAICGGRGKGRTRIDPTFLSESRPGPGAAARSIFRSSRAGTSPGLASASNLVIDGSIGLIVVGLSFFVLLRYGLLAAITMSLFKILPSFGVWTTDLSSWYAGQMMIPLLLFAAIAVYAFYISLAGRPLFSAKLFDEDGAKA